MLALQTACLHPTTNKPYVKAIIGGKENSSEGRQVCEYFFYLIFFHSGSSSPPHPSPSQQSGGRTNIFFFGVERFNVYLCCEGRGGGN